MPSGDEVTPPHLQAELADAARHLQSGNRGGAAACLARLAAAAHRDGDLHYNCGVLAGALGLLELEERCYRQALAVNPGDGAALNNLGNLLRRQGRLDEALASLDRAVAASDREPFFLHNRGLVLQALGRSDAALQDHARAIALKPDYAEAHASQGAVLGEQARHEEALASLDHALRLDPGLADAWNQRGIVLEILRRLPDALASYEQATALAPELPGPWANRGLALMHLGRCDEALACQRRALALAPEFAAAHLNLGLVYEELAQFEAAAASYAQAFALDPGLDYLPGALLSARMHACDWRDYESWVRRVEDGVAAGARCASPFKFLAVSDDPGLQLRCARIWIADKHPPATRPLCAGRARGDGRIRIAYLSADFHLHATAILAAGLFEAHDRSEFEITAISFGPDTGGPMRERLARAFDRFIEAGDRSDREVAELLAGLGTDIAVDLKGTTKGHRAGIFALRPAPVQVGYLGYPATMGATYIDYIVADRTVIPEHRQDCYAESVVYLPDSYQVNDSARSLPARTPTRDEVGLPADAFVFCSFNNSYKITPRVFDSWMRVLGAVEGSVLWLFAANAAATRNLREAAADQGIAAERLTFAPRAAPHDHLARQGLADLVLDTAPYNAHTTASDALWVGVPVLTCAGEAFASRVAASLLNAIGVPELVTHSLEAYERLAIALARDPERLAAIRARLVRNRRTHPLFDTARFTRHLEAAYRTMWERARRGEPARGFAVPAID